MSPEENFAVSEAATNVVENIAIRVAERQGGRITVNYLAPYLPMSLGLIRSCLDNMIDGHSVSAREADGFPGYEFAASRDQAVESGELPLTSCLACNADLAADGEGRLCPGCSQTIEDEFNRLAEITGWPAQAVYEHEILYLTASHPGPHYAAELAGRSRYTLKRMREKLKRMAVAGYLRQTVDEAKATLACHAPPLTYPQELYQRNMAVIRGYPASIAEETELKVTRIILTLALMLVMIFGLALMRAPLPFLLIGFAVVAPLVALKIWWRREPPPEE